MENMQTLTELKNKVKKTEDIKSYRKKYNEEHKEEIKNLQNIKVLCECCNFETTKNNMNKHIKTEKHKIKIQLYNLNKK